MKYSGTQSGRQKPPLSLLGCVVFAGAISLAACRHGDGDLGSGGAVPYPAGDSQSKPGADPAARAIVIGDRLELFVEEDTSFNGIYPVRENGDIIVPRLGRIKVAGVSPKVAQGRIKSALEDGQLLDANVIVDRLVSLKSAPAKVVDTMSVYLTGKVASAGMHRIPKRDARPPGAYETLLIAGGMTKFGDERKVHILRAGEDGRRHKIPVDVRAINSGQAADVPVRDGDIIVVPERVFGF